MISLSLIDPVEVVRRTAERAKNLRLRLNLTQEGLAARSGVPLGTLKLFERTGKISFETLIKLAFALGAERTFDDLLSSEEPKSIEDVIDKPKRVRGRRT